MKLFFKKSHFDWKRTEDAKIGLSRKIKTYFCRNRVRLVGFLRVPRKAFVSRPEVPSVRNISNENSRRSRSTISLISAHSRGNVASVASHR